MRSCCSRCGRRPEAWWRSARATIFESLAIEGAPPEIQAWMDTVRGLIESHGVDPTDEVGRRGRPTCATSPTCGPTVPADRLVEWTTGDGWEPLCQALGVPVPAEPFPHVNTTAEFRGRIGLGDLGTRRDAVPVGTRGRHKVRR